MLHLCSTSGREGPRGDWEGRGETETPGRPEGAERDGEGPVGVEQGREGLRGTKRDVERTRDLGGRNGSRETERGREGRDGTERDLERRGEAGRPEGAERDR